MSLRVLLADESASIRKVFQMGLQDFGAEVKSVHNGLDVVQVAENFQPHIIFADILLQKKNGYEVCQELEGHQNLSGVPVILMWSSFMELDQKKYQSCGANGELEKPFDVESMRKLIESHVELTKSQKVSQFLEFPNTITNGAFIEDEQSKSSHDRVTHESSDSKLSLESFDSSTPPAVFEPDEMTPKENTSVFNLQAEDGEFDMTELDKVVPPDETKETLLEISKGGTWTAKPLVDHSIDPIEAQTETDQDLEQFQSMDLQNNKDKLNLNDFLYQPEPGFAPPPVPESNTQTGSSEIQNVQMSPENTKASSVKFSAEETEMIIRQETRTLLKETLQEQLPDILEKVVREELQKLLDQELALKNSSKNL